MNEEFEKTLKQAFQKASNAQDKVLEATAAGDLETMKHWCSEYGRYCEIFGRAMGISEEKFNELVNDFRENQNKSEFVRVNQNKKINPHKAVKMF